MRAAFGSYDAEHNSGYFYPRGRGGLTATATVAAFRAAGNSSRRRAAEAAGVPPSAVCLPAATSLATSSARVHLPEMGTG